MRSLARDSRARAMPTLVFILASPVIGSACSAPPVGADGPLAEEQAAIATKSSVSVTTAVGAGGAPTSGPTSVATFASTGNTSVVGTGFGPTTTSGFGGAGGTTATFAATGFTATGFAATTGFGAGGSETVGFATGTAFATTTSFVSTGSGGSCEPDGFFCQADFQCCSGLCVNNTCGEQGGVVGFWHFDDCQASSAVLADSSRFNNTANRTANVACVAGIDGLAVDFNQKKDVVTVADDPSFAFTDHVAVAAWVNPNTTTGTHAIVEQQFGGNTTFALSVVKGSVQFSITLQNGKVVKSKAPLDAGVWSHVAGNYDGHFVFLYLNGQQVGQVDVPGAIKEANGPITIGNNTSKQFFDGAIDDVWLSTAPITVADIAALACIHKPLSFVATPANGPSVPTGTEVDYSVAVTNNDVGFCQAVNVFVSPDFVPGFSTFNQGLFEAPIAPGQTQTFGFAAISDDTVEPGTTTIPFFVEEENPPFDFFQGQVTYTVAQPTGCFVTTSRELMIRDLSVVEDPIRTTTKGPAGDARTGVWTFGALMRNLAPTPADAPKFVKQLFSTWLADQQVGGFTVPARPSMQQQVLDPWPKLANGDLDLDRSPLRLSAIVNRLDVRNLNQGKAGEGRFVFTVLDPSGFPFQFTLIVEYALPATTDADVLGWANAWHALGALPFPSEQYNAALQALTSKFTGRGVVPSKPNGSALAQLRTNEIQLAPEWELREFHLSPTTGFLQEAGDALTPDISLNGTSTLADFVNQNAATIDKQLHTVPATFENQPFQAGSSLNPLFFWTAPGIQDNEARHFLALNTCNGCHGPETGTVFLQIQPRFAGSMAELSGFLTGTSVSDPVTGQIRTFNDLAARKADLTNLVCPAAMTAAAPTAAAKKALIRTGRRQVH